MIGTYTTRCRESIKEDIEISLKYLDDVSPDEVYELVIQDLPVEEEIHV